MCCVVCVLCVICCMHLRTNIYAGLLTDWFENEDIVFIQKNQCDTHPPHMIQRATIVMVVVCVPAYAYVYVMPEWILMVTRCDSRSQSLQLNEHLT